MNNQKNKTNSLITQPIAAGDFNTIYFARSDLHWTDIIEVPVTDILKMNAPSVPKGFKKTTQLPTLTGTEYRNGEYKPTDWTVTEACPIGGGQEGGDLGAGPDDEFYFFKGYDSADCIQFLDELGLI